MQARVRCEPETLAEHGCCEILHCPHCNAVHLHVGPVSLRLPLEALRHVASATAEAEAALRQSQPDRRTPELARPAVGPCKH